MQVPCDRPLRVVNFGETIDGTRGDVRKAAWKVPLFFHKSEKRGEEDG